MKIISFIIHNLKIKFNHNFKYDIFEHTKNYCICGLKCYICNYKNTIYIAHNNYKFEKQLNFAYIIIINDAEYAYDSMLSCEEVIIKNIIE